MEESSSQEKLKCFLWSAPLLEWMSICVMIWSSEIHFYMTKTTIFLYLFNMQISHRNKLAYKVLSIKDKSTNNIVHVRTGFLLYDAW